MSEKNNSDEIELIEALKRVVKFLKDKILFFIIFTSLGILMGGLFTWLKEPEYKSSMIGISTVLTTEDVFPIIAKLNNLIEERNYEEVGKLIPLDTLLLSKIKTIAVSSEILTRKSKSDEEIITNKFNITIHVYNNNLFDTLNILIPNFIKNNKYTKLKTKLSMERMQKNYNRLDNEIKLLDSIKGKFTPGKITKDNLNLYMADPSAINETIIKLYDKQTALYELMQLSPDFLVIDNFAKYRNPINKKYFKNAIIGGGVFFILILLFLIGKEINAFTKD